MQLTPTIQDAPLVFGSFEEAQAAGVAFCNFHSEMSPMVWGPTYENGPDGFRVSVRENVWAHLGWLAQ